MELVVAWNVSHYQQLCKDLYGVYSCSTGSLVGIVSSCDELQAVKAQSLLFDYLQMLLRVSNWMEGENQNNKHTDTFLISGLLVLQVLARNEAVGCLWELEVVVSRIRISTSSADCIVHS